MRNLIATLGLQQNLAMNQGRQANLFGRLAKVEISKFQGDDVKGWAFRCDRFFSIDNTPNEEKFLSVNGENTGWEVYKNAIIQRFGSIFEDPMFALKNTKYEKNAREYQDLFDTLLCRVTISQEHAISLYLGGLPTELEMSVRMFKPVTLVDAYSLTMLQETILDAVKKKNKPSGSFNGNRFGNGGNYGNVMPDEEDYFEDCLDDEEENRTSMPTGPLAVTVADGNNLITTSECKKFQWKFDNTTFTIDVMLLPLGGCKMVLGIQCLATLGDIKCNFKELRMKFKYGEAMPVTVDGKIQAVLENYEDVFGIPVELPPQRTHDHKIPLVEGALPVNIRPYRHPPTQKDAIEAMKDNSWRMCVDYRQLNKQTIKDKFPIPIIKELIDELHGVKLFTKLDLSSGYHQIRMNEANVAKTAFRTHEGHYEFLVMPFGLTNDPSTFQALMNEVFKPYLRKFTLVFFDDMLIYSQCLEEHVRHLHIILKTMRTHKLFAKLSKCMFRTTQVEYLGHTTCVEGVAIDPAKIKAMANWSMRTSLKQLKGFLGLTGYYRSAAQPAFEALKQAMISALVLKWPNFTKEVTIETYASVGGIGAVLLREGHPIAFLSKTLSAKHQLMSTYEKEFLAVVLKWLSKLMRFDFTIVYKKGVDNVTADALSRMQNLAELLSIIGLYTWHNQQLRRKGKLMVGNDEVLRKELLQQKKMRKEVKQFMRDYEIFQRYKPNLEAYPGLLQPLSIPTSIWTSISMDFIKGLPKSRGKDVILVVVDRLSKYSHFMALSHPFTASQVAQLFLDNIYKLHGLPENVVCLECYLRCMTGDHPKQWMKWLSLAEWWAQSRMKSHDDKGRTDKMFDCGDWVILKLQPYKQVSLRQGKQNKFYPKFFRPFKIIQRIGQVAYKLELPHDSQIHNVFHVSQFKKNADIHVLIKKGNGMEVYVLVQWANGTNEDTTWESVTDLQAKFPNFDYTG
ncbi:putative mitochondrial protein [Tanacetum coccineum]